MPQGSLSAVSGILLLPELFYRASRGVLINSGLMKQPFKMCEFKANITSNSTAIAKIVNSEIACFGCWSANHELISISPGKRHIEKHGFPHSRG